MAREHDALPDFLQAELVRLKVPRSDTLLVACSGGVDSTALAHAVSRCTGQSLVLAHIDHGIREAPSRREETSTVDRLALLLQVPLKRRSVPPDRIRRIAGEESRSLEEVAREIRYRLLCDIALEMGQGVTILTAHHGEDQLETILMRLFGGRSILDSIAIGEERFLAGGAVRVVRPLLDVSRELLAGYVVARDLPFLEDPSNRDTRFLRNRIRNSIVPAIKDTFPAPALSRAAARFSRDLSALRRGLDELIPAEARGEYGEDRWRVKTETFLGLPDAAREIVLRNALYHYAGTKRLSFAPFREAADRQRSTSASGIRFLWGGQYVEVARDIVRSGSRGYLWVLDGAADLIISGDEGSVTVVDGIDCGPDRWFIGPVRAPVLVRPLRNGERVFQRGAMRDVRTLLEKHGLPREERDNAPILEDRGGFVTFLHRMGPLCTRDGIECTQVINTRQRGFVSLHVKHEDRNAERR